MPAPEAALLHDDRRGVSYAKPLLRGWAHLISFFAAVVIGAIVIAHSRGATRLVVAAVYASSVAGLFGVSALYHRGRWSARMSTRLQRLDHTMIVVLIAGTATPPMVLCLTGSPRLVALVGLWSLAATAVVVRLTWLKAPEKIVGSIYLGLGWIAGAAIPAVWIRAGVAPAALLIAGGLLYTLGAISYHRRSPDPRPSIFGYHEVFHTYVSAAAACQYVAIACFLL